MVEVDLISTDEFDNLITMTDVYVLHKNTKNIENKRNVDPNKKKKKKKLKVNFHVPCFEALCGVIEYFCGELVKMVCPLIRTCLRGRCWKNQIVPFVVSGRN